MIVFAEYYVLDMLLFKSLLPFFSIFKSCSIKKLYSELYSSSVLTKALHRFLTIIRTIATRESIP